MIPDFIPSRFIAETVISEWPQKDMSATKVLIPRAQSARDFIPESLEEMGAVVDIVSVYETVKDHGNRDLILDMLTKGKIDYLTFTSSSTVTNFIESIGPDNIHLLNDLTIVSLGPITAETARNAGLTTQIVAEEYSIPGLVQEISDHAKNEEQS